MSRALPKLRAVRFSLVIPIAFLLFATALYGLEDGVRAAAYLAFTRRDYATSLERYLAIGDHCGAGMSYLALNRLDDAERCFKVSRDSSGLALCELKRRNYRAALSAACAAKDDRAEGLVCLAMRDEKGASDAFTRANDWSGLGLLCLAKKDCAGARNCFEKVDDRSGLALVALAEEKFDEAEMLFGESNDERGLGLVALARRDFATAIDHFLRVNDVSGLGYAYMAQGDFSIAEHFFRQVNDWDGLGDLYSQTRNFEGARECFEKDSNPLKVIQSYRNDYSRTDAHEKALEYGNRAVLEGRMPAECLMEMADILYELKRPQEALAYLDQVAAFPGYASDAHFRKGRILFYLRDLVGAKKEFESVRSDDLTPARTVTEAMEALETVKTYLTGNMSALLAPAPSF